MDFPAGLKYTKDHEWIKVEGDEALPSASPNLRSANLATLFISILHR